MKRCAFLLMALGLSSCVTAADEANYGYDDLEVFVQQLREEIASFAESEPAIEGCTYLPDEEEPTFERPYCRISSVGTLSDQITGRFCAIGPGESVMIRRGSAYGPFAYAENIVVFFFTPDDDAKPNNNELQSSYAALFDEKHEYLGVQCPRLEEIEQAKR